VWAYVLILIIGVAVTVAGVRLGRRRRDDPFADVTSPDDAASDATTSEPAPFASHREPAPLGTAGAETAGSPATVAGSRAPRATLEERLREARDARAAQHDDARSGDAIDEAATPVEPSAPDAVGGATRTEASAAAIGSGLPTAPSAEAAGSDSAPETTASLGEEPTELEPEAEAAPSGTATGPIREPVTRRALAPGVRDDFAQRWTPIRMRLLARPAAAVGDADAFVRNLLAARGLPNDPDDPAMSEASNAYPDVIDPFRLATAIARSAEDGTADPQQLRLATVHYRDAVERLLAGDDLPVA